MSFVTKLLGSSDTVEAIGNAIDKVTTTDEERAAGEIIKARLQVDLNKVEAQHRSLFVAGWRPAIGWICSFSLAVYFIPQFVIGTIFWTLECIAEGGVVPYPLSVKGLMELVLGMLGLAGLRTYEKYKGRTR